MIRSRFTLAGQMVLRDADGNFISIIKILEHIKSEGFPMIVPQVSFVSSLSRENADPARYEGEFTVDLDNDRLNTLAVAVNFENGLSSTLIINVSPVIIAHPGRLVFAFTTGTFRAEYQVDVTGTIAAQR